MWQFCLASPLPKAYCEELLEACLALAAAVLVLMATNTVGVAVGYFFFGGRANVFDF